MQHTSLSFVALLLSLTLPALSQTTVSPSPSIDMGNGYVVPGAAWEHVSPATAGFSAARLDVLRAWLKTQPTTALMAVSRGKVVFEYGDVSRATNVASVRKSILSILFAAELNHLPNNLNVSTVVAHKVDIDADPAAAISPLGYQVALDMLLDAKSAGADK